MPDAVDFRSLESNRRWIDLAQKHSVPVTKKAGDTVMEQGDVGREAYIILSGEVNVVLTSGVSMPVGPGNIVGEMSLIDLPQRSASVVAATECKLVPVNAALFLTMVREEPTFALFVMDSLAQRLRAAHERAAELLQAVYGKEG